MEHQTIDRWYSWYLSQLKRLGLKDAEMPPDVAESMLVIHQHATWAYMKRKERTHVEQMDRPDA